MAYSSPAITGNYNGPLGRRYGLRQHDRSNLAAILLEAKPVYGRKECLNYTLWLRWIGIHPAGSAWFKNKYLKNFTS